MNALLAIFTYFAYIFIVVMYTKKAVKWLGMPTHIRWDLYPVSHEENYQYGGSYFEHMDWWTRARKKRLLRSTILFLKEYLYLESYWKKKKGYWSVLYLSHIGYILLIIFQALCFFSAIFTISGVSVSAGSPDFTGRTFYYLVLFAGVICFVSGMVGSIGLLAVRLIDKDLKLYTSPSIFFGYGFHFALFLSGFYCWFFVDPTFFEYRQFWVGLLTFSPASVKPAWGIYIIISGLHLIYLPYTRAFHYVTRFFAFFLIRWDDEPNVRGSELEKRLQKLISQQKVTWSAPHIKSGETWLENVKNGS
jgi:nitrate reductase gamma subunit